MAPGSGRLIAGGSKRVSPTCLCEGAYRKPNKGSEKRSKCPPPSSIAPIDIARSPRIGRQHTGGSVPGLARTRSQDRPVRLRFPACATAPRCPKNHLPAHARSAAELSPVLPASAARRSPRPGDFCRVTPLARKRPTKMASRLPAVTSLIAGRAARKPDHGTGFGEDNHGVAERAAMFAQMRFCGDYCTEPATGSKQPTRPDRRRSPPTELTGSGLYM
jgi:hypothetical protein